MVHYRRITWLLLCTLFLQQGLLLARSIQAITPSGEYSAMFSMAMHTVDCASHASHQQHAMHHCQNRGADSLSHHNHSSHQGHCEFCMSGCQSLLAVCLELPRIDTEPMDALAHYLLLIPSSPINNLFRPPIYA